MTEFDDHLRNALSRVDPGEEFTRRVLENARARRTGHVQPRWRPWAAGCVAASLLMGSWGLVDLEQRRQRQQAKAVQAELRRALKITSVQLQRIHKKLEGLSE